MTWFVVDVEADGPAPDLYSLVSIGAVRLDPVLTTTFYGRARPLPNALWQKEALAVSGTTREQHLTYPDPIDTMEAFNRWIYANTFEGTEPVLVSDNNGYDAAFINYYFHFFVWRNPFGHSSRRIGDLWCGMKGSVRNSSEWKKLRKTKPTHNPVDDAKGNAEALLAMFEEGLEPPAYFERLLAEARP